MQKGTKKNINGIKFGQTAPYRGNRVDQDQTRLNRVKRGQMGSNGAKQGESGLPSFGWRMTILGLVGDLPRDGG